MSKEKLELELKVVENKLSSFGDILIEIKALEKEKKSIKRRLEKINFEELNFEEKFTEWFYKRKGEIDSYFPGADKNIRKLMDFIGYRNDRRYETVYFSDEEFECLFSWITDRDAFEEYSEHFWVKKDWDMDKLKELIYSAAREIMKENIKGFKNDW